MALKKFLLIFLIINLVVNGTSGSVNCHACSWSDGDSSTTNDCVTNPSKENSLVQLCLACEIKTTTNMITGKVAAIVRGCSVRTTGCVDTKTSTELVNSCSCQSNYCNSSGATGRSVSSIIKPNLASLITFLVITFAFVFKLNHLW